MELDDMALVHRAVRDKSQRAFAELVNRHQSRLRYSLRQLTGWDEALADDMVQETFIKAYRALPGYRGDARFSTWLYRIAYNQLTSWYRKRREVSSGDDREPEDKGHNPIESGDLHRDLAAAMGTLVPEQRMALHLYLQRECTHSEIAQIMDIPLGTVKSHILRGREKLQAQLSAWREAANG